MGCFYYFFTYGTTLDWISLRVMNTFVLFMYIYFWESFTGLFSLTITNTFYEIVSFGWLLKKKSLISTKTFIGKISMSSRFNQSKVYFYVHIYPALSIIYCAQMVFATLARRSCQVWWSIFRFSKVVVFHCINGLFLKAVF